MLNNLSFNVLFKKFQKRLKTLTKSKLDNNVKSTVTQSFMVK